MNQQNKTERWEMEKIKNIVHRIYMDEDLMSGAREIKQLLSDARREEREKYKEVFCDAGYAIETIRGYIEMENKEEAEKHLVSLSKTLLDEALTTAEESIRNLK